MVSEVIGYYPVNFTDQATGNQIIGTSVFLTEPISQIGGAGVQATKVFIRNWSQPFLGKANVEVNLNGKVVNITPSK